MSLKTPRELDVTHLAQISYLMQISCNLFFFLWQNLYRGAGKRSLPTGYRLPVDTPHFRHSKDTQYMSSYVSALLIVKMGSEVGGPLAFITSLFSPPQAHPEGSTWCNDRSRVVDTAYFPGALWHWPAPSLAVCTAQRVSTGLPWDYVCATQSPWLGAPGCHGISTSAGGT